MQRRKIERGDRRRLFGLAGMTGLLLAAAFPPVPTGITAFVALIPFLFLLDALAGDSAGRVFRYVYVAFLVFNAGTIWWVSGWWGQDPWLKAAGVAVNLVHPVLFTVPALVLHLLRRRLGTTPTLAVFPFLWTAWEYLLHLPELSFPWLLLANTQCFDIEKVQFIEYTGAFGASFWIVSVNVLLTLAARTLLEGGAAAWRRAVRPLAAAAMLLAAPEIHGRIVLAEPVGGSALRVAIAQPNMDPYEKWGAGESAADKLANLMRLYDSSVTFARPDLVLFPETAIPFYIRQPSYSAEWAWLRAHIDSAGVPLLTGFPDLAWYERDAPAGARKLPEQDVWYQSFNSTMVLLPGDSRVGVYHKSRLTPMSERIPYLDMLPFLQDALTWGVGISNWGLGNDTTVLALDRRRKDARIWAMICYETLYPSFVAGFVARGANALLVVTNDGWFGNSSGPYQLQRYAVLRAIETRRAVARCANNGISCFIDPYGRVSQETQFGTRGWIAGPLPLRADTTVFAAHGDWFAQLCLVLAAAATLAAIFLRRKKEQ
ncbi:MAG: apolipoprotein N-acyltransferase [Ignavibacteriae bacterium]|nr:apolipoprotein N-acyltransferase [Ignavibacteriota bacterium]